MASLLRDETVNILGAMSKRVLSLNKFDAESLPWEVKTTSLAFSCGNQGVSMKHGPTLLDPRMEKKCESESAHAESRFVHVSVAHLSYFPVCKSIKRSLVDVAVSPVLVDVKKPVKKMSVSVKFVNCLRDAGSVFDLAGSYVELGELGSLQDDYHMIAKDFRTVGNDLRHVFSREKRKLA